MLPRKVFIATSNPGKLRDFAGVMAGVKALRLELLPDFSRLPAVEEDGATFAANAAKKAAFYSAYAGSAIVLADDSGLEVAPLNGAPGVRSARYAADDSPAFKNAYTPLSPDEANNQRLLRELAGVPPEKRAGRFVCFANSPMFTTSAARPDSSACSRSLTSAAACSSPRATRLRAG